VEFQSLAVLSVLARDVHFVVFKAELLRVGEDLEHDIVLLHVAFSDEIQRQVANVLDKNFNFALVGAQGMAFDADSE
jgi:hypothetical protein